MSGSEWAYVCCSQANRTRKARRYYAANREKIVEKNREYRRRGRYDDLDGYRQWLATQGLDPRQVDEYVVKTRSLIAHGVTTEEALQSAYNPTL